MAEPEGKSYSYTGFEAGAENTERFLLVRLPAPKSKDDIYQVVQRKTEEAPIRSNKFKHE